MTESVTSSQLKDSTPYRSLAEDNRLQTQTLNSGIAPSKITEEKENKCLLCL